MNINLTLIMQAIAFIMCGQMYLAHSQMKRKKIAAWTNRVRFRFMTAPYGGEARYFKPAGMSGLA